MNSPDMKNHVNIYVEDEIKYSVSHGNREILGPSEIDAILGNGNTLREKLVIIDIERRLVKDHLKPVVNVKKRPIIRLLDSPSNYCVELECTKFFQTFL